MSKTIIKTPDYQSLVVRISDTYIKGLNNAYKAVNTELLQTNWEIGQYIVEFEQKGKIKATYGTALLDNLSKDLKLLHGKGFSKSNLVYMRLCYIKYPISEKLSHQLSWSHYLELVKISNELERSFYEKQCLLEKWSVPELKRQKKASLFLRLAGSKDKAGILELAKHGQIIQQPSDLIREPFILEFLKIPEPYHLSESDLEKRLIDNLQHFLLELGKGFAFIGRQYRIVLGNRPHYVDLVFYHRILKCFVLIDLKKEEAGYEDVGQMNMYLGYFEEEENTEGDNPPIGIILAREKDELQIKYAMHNVSSQLFVSKYQLYLPNEQELRREIELMYAQAELDETNLNDDLEKS
jgi:predicted nuclease of restriction endonuclease-like (RecB) superfamily